MAGAVVKFLKETYGKQSLTDAVKAGGWKSLIDGSLAQATLVHGPNATLVGTDGAGNKYFERTSEQYGRHRWVVYANLDWLTGQDPGKIPGEWHGWLHQITDETPVTHPATFAAPPYALPYRGYASGTPARYQPKGAWHNPQRRNWRKVETWEPPAA